MWPRLLRAPLRLLPAMSGLCGCDVVISSKLGYSWKRLAGLVGFTFLIAMASHALEELDRLLAVGEPDVGLLPLRAVALEATLPAFLAGEPGHAHVGDLALELSLDRLLDLDLVRPRRHLERD